MSFGANYVTNNGRQAIERSLNLPLHSTKNIRGPGRLNAKGKLLMFWLFQKLEPGLTLALIALAP
jgi:hypothetical protein